MNLFSSRAQFHSRLMAAAVVGGSLLTGLSGCACHTNSCCTPCSGSRLGFGGGGLFGGGAGLRSAAIPDRYPLGSVVREPFHVMQTNAEATDFVLYHNDFIGDTVELTPDGKDHVLEIAARMRSAPFPVLVERTENNANPQLDAERRLAVAQVLYDHGNSDADQRTFVSQAYSRGLNNIEPQSEFYRNQFTRGNNFGGGFGGGGGGGGFGGGGFGGGGFGGGGFGGGGIY
jgi:hypothetical protein